MERLRFRIPLYRERFSLDGCYCQLVIRMFSGGKAFKHLERLAVEIGSRDSGSVEEREAAEYIASVFKDLGLETTLQEFDVETGRVLEQRLEVLEPYEEEIECMALPLAGGTGAEEEIERFVGSPRP